MNRHVGSRLAMGGWLLAVWLLLWGRVDGATLVGGIAAVLVAYRVTRLPAVPVVTRVRPVRLAESALEFARDLVVSSAVIGWHALRDPGRIRGAIVEVAARSRSQVVLMTVMTSMSLRPGTLLVGVDWDRAVLRVHGMPVRDRAEADAVRDGVLHTERGLMRALVVPDDPLPDDPRTEER
ncbi:Na+/H+ antiporter subunit E [Actinomadura decatromicini]|uniref:Na+/H+ antiporter subunit E n=1 Tax=Actinomadura decatromicini TaxID=2604572 RepID=A0A5D3FGT7_9ACTN|nr:Na+/H+ antiporter subunit E [Actinomadura decatromicini]TYK48097.1 hypothetical protein FXF68_20710 [Actinomadura decatromicini]